MARLRNFDTLTGRLARCGEFVETFLAIATLSFFEFYLYKFMSYASGFGWFFSWAGVLLLAPALLLLMAKSLDQLNDLAGNPGLVTTSDSDGRTFGYVSYEEKWVLKARAAIVLCSLLFTVLAVVLGVTISANLLKVLS